MRLGSTVCAVSTAGDAASRFSPEVDASQAPTASPIPAALSPSQRPSFDRFATRTSPASDDGAGAGLVAADAGKLCGPAG